MNHVATRKLRQYAPIAAWARRLGVNRVTLQQIIAGVPCVSKGYAAQRLVMLVQSLERGEWKWVITGDPRRARNYTWTGEAPFERDRRPKLAVALEAGRTPRLSFSR